MSNAAEVFESASTGSSIDIGADMEQYLTFIMAGEEYGVDILRVQEIRGWDTVTSIPNTPEFIKGVMNLRGTIVPIIDLRLRFGLDTMDYGPTTVVIVLKVVSKDSERIMGIVVDAVSEVYNMDSGSIKPPPDFGDVVSIDFVRGLSTVDEKMIIILDIDHMLNTGEIDLVGQHRAVLSQAKQQASNE